MRQREITWQGWRVSWPDVDGVRHEFTADECVDADYEATALRKAGVADVRVVRVTRYRLAPLVEIAAWRLGMNGDIAGDPNDSGPWASVWFGLRWNVLVEEYEAKIESHGYPTRAAAMAAAEAHLAVLGYRVKKEERR